MDYFVAFVCLIILQCTLLGAQEEPAIDTRPFRSIIVANMPCPDSPHITPEGPYLHVTCTEV